MSLAPSILWDWAEAEAATGGVAYGGWTANGVAIDTRSIETHDLFIALRGDARDGHDFVTEALRKGAAAALVSHRPQGVAPDAPLLIVSDTQAGLEGLGRAARTRSQARIVAVTGSAGKTTTKEMLRLMLRGEGAGAGIVAASAASYNNHWGVPLSLARMPREAAFGIFEIGMNHAGEIRRLVKEVRPHVAVITNVAPAHLEYFGGVQAIADAKAEIFEGLEAGGAAILPLDNPQFGRLRARAQEAGVKKILSFGADSGADARLIAVEPGARGQSVAAEIGGVSMRFTIGASGAHIAMNALASLLAVRELGANVRAAAAALGEFTALKGRGAWIAAGDIDIIDESYNANPASMKAAIALLGQAAPRGKGRRIAVLGDMLELGADADALHRGLAKELSAAHADLVFLCGPLMSALWEVLPAACRGAYAENSAKLAAALVETAREGDVVLVKGSNANRMSAVIDSLRARARVTA